MIRLLLALLCCVPLLAAANNDDGFVWLDANTKIRLAKPASITPVCAARGGSAETKKEAGKEQKDKARRK